MPMRATRLVVAALLVAAVPALAAEPTAPRPPAAFAALDGDGDGKLTAQELHAAREQQMARFDHDGDGRLSAAEYQAWWLDAGQARLARQFRADDADKNGAVTLEELVGRSQELLRRRDADHDGILSAEEWRPHRQPRQPGPA